MATQSAALAAAAPPRAAPWIRSAWVDLPLFLLTPIFLIPLILLRRDSPGAQNLILLLGTTAALGHHLPGMMRAYGDRGLFRRFRTRFLLAPLFLVAVCGLFAAYDLHGVVLITFFWTTWHTLMQIYGFARIYDAKAGPSSRLTARLDHLLCLAWIGAPILLSDSRLSSVLELYYRAGGPLLPATLLAGLRAFWSWGTVALTAAYAAQLLFQWRSGKLPNPAKLLLYATSFSYWWFCMAMVDHLLAGVALFDVFHDVQYLALVWYFNRQRVEKDPGVGRFSRFLFRRSLVLAGLYVLLVAAYGSSGRLVELAGGDLVQRVLLGVLTASALLHFYFDGFIWKVREASTRAPLGLTGGTPDRTPRRPALPGWAAHGLKWSWFVVPLGVFAAWELFTERAEQSWRQAVVAALPESAEANTSLGVLLVAGGEVDGAVARHRRAVALKPRHPEAHHNLAVALRLQGQLEEAEAEFRTAIRLRPEYAAAHGHLANLLVQRGDDQHAEIHYREAIHLDRRYADPRANLGALLARQGKSEEAISWLRAALAVEPDNPGALNNLAWLLATAPAAAARNGAEAVALAERGLEIAGREQPRAYDTLAAAYAEAGRYDDAVAAAADGLDLARQRGEDALAQSLAARLACYQRGQPWRSGEGR